MTPGRRNLLVAQAAALQVAMLLLLLTAAGPASARPGRFSHASFVVSSGLSSSGSASESQVTHANGTTTGECAFTDDAGRTVKVRYVEAPDGTLTSGAEAELRRCREAVSRIGGEIEADLARHQDLLRAQRADLRRQQEAFERQQEEFQELMEALRNQIQDEQRRLQEALRRQQRQFHEQQEQLFQNLRNIPALNFR